MLGLTFKENVPDLRNSKVVDVIRNLETLGHHVTVHDPLADADEAVHEYGLVLKPDALAHHYDIVIGAVAHAYYAQLDPFAYVKSSGLVADLKRLWPGAVPSSDKKLWSL
jgi:UDP-N-acetyl-D-galactosamine dehydrogenase